jgi:hypothetical protein
MLAPADTQQVSLLLLAVPRHIQLGQLGSWAAILQWFKRWGKGQSARCLSTDVNVPRARAGGFLFES